MQFEGIKDVRIHFCLGSEKTPWTASRRWLTLLMLLLTIGSVILMSYNSSFNLSVDLTFFGTSKNNNNMNTTSTSSVSLSAVLSPVLCHPETKMTIIRMTKANECSTSSCFFDHKKSQDIYVAAYVWQCWSTSRVNFKEVARCYHSDT